jgi:protein-disulfide isomerase
VRPAPTKARRRWWTAAALLLLAGAAGAGSRVRAAVPAAPSPPPDRRVVLRGKPVHVLGSARARVTMVEFGDYECPFCRQYHDQVFPQIKAEYVDTGKVRYVVRDLPIPVHEHAAAAAEAAGCAGAQGRFWPMRQVLIAHSRELTDFGPLAREAEVPLAAFEACRAAHTFAKAVQSDVADALAAGLDRTPSFVIGRATEAGTSGIVVVGARPYSFFRERLERALRAP